MPKSKKLKIAGIAFGILAFLAAVFAWAPSLIAFLMTKIAYAASSVGMIGGADGPTSVYVAMTAGIAAWLEAAMPVLLAAVSVLCFVLRKKFLKKGE